MLHELLDTVFDKPTAQGITFTAQVFESYYTRIAPSSIRETRREPPIDYSITVIPVCHSVIPAFASTCEPQAPKAWSGVPSIAYEHILAAALGGTRASHRHAYWFLKVTGRESIARL